MEFPVQDHHQAEQIWTGTQMEIPVLCPSSSPCAHLSYPFHLMGNLPLPLCELDPAKIHQLLVFHAAQLPNCSPQGYIHLHVTQRGFVLCRVQLEWSMENFECKAELSSSCAMLKKLDPPLLLLTDNFLMPWKVWNTGTMLSPRKGVG